MAALASVRARVRKGVSKTLDCRECATGGEAAFFTGANLEAGVTRSRLIDVADKSTIHTGATAGDGGRQIFQTLGNRCRWVRLVSSLMQFFAWSQRGLETRAKVG
jgi:hypothetical protein